MSTQPFARPKGNFRFSFGGLKVNAAPDALSPNKFPLAINVRSYEDEKVRTRPGWAGLFNAGASPVTDLRAYSALSTDNLPRFLVHDSTDKIWLDTGIQIGSLAPSSFPGASMIPFRPNQSPVPFMYIANGADYQKFSAPDGTDAVVQRKVGIAEPQQAPDSIPQAQMYTELLAPNGQWVTGGTASGWTAGNRSSDAIVACLPDPAGGVSSPRWSIQTGAAVQYQRGEIVNFNGTPSLVAIIEDAIAPLDVPMTVEAIYYFSGSTGRCIIVPQGVGLPFRARGNTSGASVESSQALLIAQFRRGALVKIGTEVCYVWSVTSGPNNLICIETSTVATHATGESLVGVPTIVVNGVPNSPANPAATTTLAPGTAIIGDQGNTESFAVAVGIGTLTMGAASGSTGVIARPTTFLNGWGPSAHVGAYELGVDQAFNWGLNPDTTLPYATPGAAFDNNLATAASAQFAHTHQYAGCIWAFAVVAPTGNPRTLNINSQVTGPTKRSAGIWYSIDGGTNWTQVYNQAFRGRQWDAIPLNSAQDLSKVQVMAFTDSHDDMNHYVFEINITEIQLPSINAGTGVYQPDDYIHLSLKLDNPTNLNELKIQFDIGDGSFSQNYLYFTVRPSDIILATGNSLTGLATLQSLLQKAAIDAAGASSGLSSPDTTVPGANQWSEIWFPISAFTRVGGDSTKSLADIRNIQVLVNASGTCNLSISSLAFVGGGNPDTGDVGAPLLYAIRPRDSRTGVVGNPSPATRYGAIARRQHVTVTLVSAAYDTQIDTWDVFRYGGSVPQWRFIGSTPSTNTSFDDNYDNEAAGAGNALDFDNFEPWPSVDVPFTATGQITGTIATLTLAAPGNILRFLPGTLIQVGGQNVYTLRSRPVALGAGVYQFEFIENAGASVGVSLVIYEPEIANQPLPFMWGPDVNGTIFACGDPLRPGTLYFSKGNTPDSAPSRYNVEITPPSEPLLGGEIVDGRSFVFSSERCWALYPQPENPAQRYAFVQQPLTRGLAAPLGHCTDGREIFYWVRDGIHGTARGSLTDADLYTLFPHEGIAGRDAVYNGVSIPAPNYALVNKFRLAHSNGFLYATYVDGGGAYRQLVLDLRRGAWCVDASAAGPVTAYYHIEQQAESGAVANPVLLAAIASSPVTIGRQADFVNDLTSPITATLATYEFDDEDLRAQMQWGDYFLDVIPRAPAGVLSRPMSGGAPIAPSSIIPSGTARSRVPLSVGGLVIADFIGLFLSWVDDFLQQSDATTLFAWQPSYQTHPARVIGWKTLGSSFGLTGYGHLRQIGIAWISTTPVTLQAFAVDGQSPPPVIIPSSGGVYKKQRFPFGPNKGQLFSFEATASAPFQFFMDDFELHIGQWGREEGYTIVKDWGERNVEQSPI